MAHKTESGNTSRAWAGLEERVAHLLREAGFKKTKTLPRDRSVSKPDVDVPEIPELAIDTKYKNAGWVHHTKFLNEVEPYKGMKRYGDKSGKIYETCVMPTRSGGSKDIFVTLRIEDWIRLLQLAFIRGKAPGWKCPQCPGSLELAGTLMGFFLHRCERCNQEVMTSNKYESDVVNKEDLKSRREKTKKTVVKDFSKMDPNDPETPGALIHELVENLQPEQTKADSQFKPLKGQRTVQDVLKRNVKKETKIK